MASHELTALTFSQSPAGLEGMRPAGNVVHALCTGGSFSFTANHVRYNVQAADYAIFPVGVVCSKVVHSDDCRVLLMSFPEAIVSATAFNSNYGIFGHLSLLTNPVIHLSPDEFRLCLNDLTRLSERAAQRHHLFHDELMATLLKAHILDLYDIHARSCRPVNPQSRTAELMNSFIRLLMAGDVLTGRSLTYYADRLCITPHYLSEICKKTGGQPATYWINRFFLREVIRHVADKSQSLERIALRLNFSSVSYLTRYVKKQLGLTPSELRKGTKT